MMDFKTKFKCLPKDARWQDFIHQLICPQCQVYNTTNLAHLERHTFLHCKSRNPILRNHIRKIKSVSSKAEEDPVELIRLMLEAKLLQWQNEGMPEIPMFLKQDTIQRCTSETEKCNSYNLDLWRLWNQEVERQSLEHQPAEILQLLAQSEALDWEYLDDGTLPGSQSDDQLNSELIALISSKLRNSHAISIKQVDTSEDIDVTAIERLENEAFLVSSMSR